ncbi:response regulator with CheY-like receiver domain and winged-helix DNA-binding domain [Synechococcus sp. PCC 7502]|uniref:response regulator transcription factor n=1 Tax=Synechococcus sp. PCC 7502 TaxID=1173263 RepID=UPI00029FF4FA|nr:response regulator transcription factor [Synechococcus sp. PCC 7502]AFY74109.1 response regulator with CheY-like receiver domain and winged-helix DNA-binding domain [Synechococcus sp. PCC 7502]
MKILVVEDDQRILMSLVEALSDRHYAVDTAIDGLAGWELIKTFPYDLVVLDLMLPKLDGISLCHQLRQAGYTMPVLMLTAKDTSSDKVSGLDVGADDYVIKPFDLKELLARIRALLRRGTRSSSPILVCGDLQLDPATCKVTYGDHPLFLTPKEYMLLELLLRHNGRTLSRNDILDHLWSSEDPPGQETVKVHIRGLRQKLKAVNASHDFIETVYGLGYRLKQGV